MDAVLPWMCARPPTANKNNSSMVNVHGSRVIAVLESHPVSEHNWKTRLYDDSLLFLHSMSRYGRQWMVSMQQGRSMQSTSSGPSRHTHIEYGSTIFWADRSFEKVFRRKKSATTLQHVTAKMLPCFHCSFTRFLLHWTVFTMKLNMHTIIIPCTDDLCPIMLCTLKAKFHHAILVADRSEAGHRPAARWNLAYHLL